MATKIVVGQPPEVNPKRIAKRRPATAGEWPPIFDLFNDAMLAGSLDGIITSWNVAAERMFGYAATDVIGQPLRMLYRADGFPAVEQILAHVAVGGQIEPYETTCLHKDGHALEVSITAMPVKSAAGKIIGLSKIVRDVTELNRIKSLVEEQSALLQHTEDGILIFDLDGRISFWNKGAERIYGWRSDEAVGRPIAQFIFADAGQFDEVNAATLERGEWSGELLHVDTGKRELVVQVRKSLLRDREGRPKSILSIHTNITEKRKIEVQLSKAKKIESLGVLAGGIAHDLNNVLTPILLSIDVLKKASMDPQTEFVLDTIEMSARRGSEIVQQVLSLASGMEGQRIVIQPRYLFKDITHLVKATFPANIRLQIDLAHDAWTTLADPTQVQQILLNLCLNARDAMPDGGTLSLGAENCLADEQYAAMNETARPGAYVVISVADTGAGMSPEIIAKIFEPFFTTKGVGKGTGLGLASVKAIVENHAGFINVYSEQGRGTTFKVYLPAQRALSGPFEERANGVSLPRGTGETVLVVDDESSILSITSETLLTFGYQVLTACNGAEAVATYAQQKKEIGIVLTDLSMPVMDGLATIYALLKINPQVKIVAMSGMDDQKNTAAVANAGIKHFIAKPYTAETLLNTLKALREDRVLEVV